MASIIITTALVILILLVARTVMQPDSEAIAQWAEKEDVTVLEMKRCYFLQGPFSFSRIEGAVYAIVVED
jgi:hypothetical protein